MKRLRFVILHFFEEIYYKNLKMIAETIPRFEQVHQFGGKQSFPNVKGSLLFACKSRYLMVSAGTNGGVINLVKCWQQVTCSNENHPNQIILFYVHLSQDSLNPRIWQDLWEFTLSNARASIGEKLNGYFATCHRPPSLDPHSDISLPGIEYCRSQLKKQGILAKFQELLSNRIG